MFGKQKKRPSIDVNRLTGAAMAAFMTPNGEPESSSSKNHRESSNGSGAIGTVSAVAIGAALAVTARAAYAKAREKLDLERVADAVEQRLGD
jgi:hypothetical protein